jgi:hypothetical protein
VGALLLASATGVLRIAADDHYASDVIVGALVGIAAGYLFPKLAYYRPEGMSFMFSTEPGTLGLRISIASDGP